MELDSSSFEGEESDTKMQEHTESDHETINESTTTKTTLTTKHSR